MSTEHSKESIQEHIRVYIMVFGALAVLTAEKLWDKVKHIKNIVFR